MSLLQNTAEGGTNGSNATNATTGGGSGDAFTAANKGSGASLIFATAAADHGSLGYSITGTSGTATFVGWTGYNDTSIAVRFYYNPGPTLPSTSLRLIDIRSSSATAARVMLNASNILFVQNSAGSTLKTYGTALSPNTWYRIEMAITISATAGTINCDYYIGDSGTPAETGYATSTGNTGSANIVSAYMGSTANATWTGTCYLDDIAANNGTTTYIGAASGGVSVPGAPTAVSATAANAQATITYTAPSSNGGGAISGYTATSTPGTITASVSGATASPITVTGLTNGTAYTFTVHATNSAGNSSESSPSSAVTPSAPASIVNNSAEGGTNGSTASTSNTGGASGNAFSTVSIASGSTFIFSNTSPERGSLSYALTGVSGNTTFYGWSGYNDTSMAVRFYFNMGSALPGVQIRPLNIRNSSAGAVNLVISATGVLSVQDSTSVNLVNFATPLATNTWYRMEVGMTVSASAGTIHAAYYLGDGSSPVDTQFTTSTANTGSTAITNVRFGSTTSSTRTGTAYFDDLAVANGTSTFIGVPVAPSAPTGPTATAGNGTASVAFTPGSTGGSAITSYTVTSTPGSFTGSGAASPIIVSSLTDGTAYTFTVHATNEIGTSSESSASNSVTPTASLPTANAGNNQTVQPYADVFLSGSYTTQSGHTASVAWTALSGAPAITAGATTDSPEIANIGGPLIASGGEPVDTNYTYQMTVTQDDSQTASSTTVVTVIFANRYRSHSSSWVPQTPTKHATGSAWV
jgi:hypothetical protein